MKNLFLSAFALLSFSAFAQTPPGTTQPWDMHCEIYTFYACDSNGNEITDPESIRYRKYTVQLCHTHTEDRIAETKREMVANELCNTGKITEILDRVKILSIERSSPIRFE